MKLLLKNNKYIIIYYFHKNINIFPTIIHRIIKNEYINTISLKNDIILE